MRWYKRCLLFPTAIWITVAVANSSTPVALVAADENQVVFTFTAEVVPTDRGIKIADCEPIALPGEPDLPGKVVLIGVPPEGNVNLKFTVESSTELKGMTINPAPGLTEKPVPPGEQFQRDQFWPGQPVELQGIEIVRGIRVARVRINPVQFNPVRGVLKVHHRIKVTLMFSQPAKNRQTNDPLDRVLKRLLLNGEVAVNWKIAPASPDSINFFRRFGIWCRIKTESTGVYRISPTDLREAGFNPATIDPRTFRLFTIGRYQQNGPYPDTMIELPIYVAGEEDGRFDSRDYLLFYARSPSYWNDSLNRWQENYYTRHACFWLTWGADPGKRMTAVSGAGATAGPNRALRRTRVEEDRLCPARGGLLWVWERYTATGGSQVMFHRDFELPAKDTLKKLIVRFYGWKDEGISSYPVTVLLNGVVLDTVRIEAKNREVPPTTIEFDSLPLTAEPGKRDTLTFVPLGPADFYLDYIEAEYITRLDLSVSGALEFIATGPADWTITGASGEPLLLDVTDPLQPRRIVDYQLTGGELRFRHGDTGFAVFSCSRNSGWRRPFKIERRNPGELLGATERADYYIVCPDEFLPAARDFARYREEHIASLPGARVRAVGLSAIYDDYAFGMEEPGAIKAFFRAKQPAYGLLAGDATYDYKNNLQLGLAPGVPAYEIGFDLDFEVYNPIVKALDAWFADFEGGGSSPDMILGRITCRSGQELRQFLDKVRRYETQELGLWTNRFLLMADDEYLGDPDKPESFIHQDNCENIAAVIKPGLDLEKLYLVEYPFEGVRSKPKAAAELLRRLNAGALLWFFFGHGAGFQLCHERAFNIDDVPLIDNHSRTPLAFFGSCGVGRFEDTRYQAIAEELVRQEDGCIATLAASKATYSSANETFARLFLNKLFAQPGEPIGNAFYSAWLTYNLYILFGDPALTLRIAQPEPLTIATASDTMFAGGVINWQATVSLNNGWFELRATEAEKERFYSSSVGSRTYRINGQEIFRGGGKFQNNTIAGAFMVPRLSYPDTITLLGGWAVRKRENCQLSAILWSGSETRVIRSSPLYLAQEMLPVTDSQPPAVFLSADNVLLKVRDTIRVPRRFNLRGRITDPAGVFLLSDPNYGLSFFVGDRSQRREIADRFSYEPNSATTGGFNYPVTLERTPDSLFFTAADNCLNRWQGVYYLKTDLREELSIDSALVYPNPVYDRAFFTFIISRPAQVTVKIYTISGRLIRVIGPQMVGFGYNQIEWDGRDREGVVLPGGVYLYKIDARATDESLASRTATVRDRFIVRPTRN